MSALTLIAILLTSGQNAETFDIRTISKPTAPVALSVKEACAQRVGDEIVICGSGRNDDRYRLPLRGELVDEDARRSEERLGGVAALSSGAPCGIFAGERRCRKAEAAKYGYGGGRDPLTIVTKLADKLIDPDSD
jgi:hypothetical protein